MSRICEHCCRPIRQSYRTIFEQVYYYVIAPTVVELGQIKNRLNLQIKELLDKEGFELAYNSATVYLEQETEGKDQ